MQALTVLPSSEYFNAVNASPGNPMLAQAPTYAPAYAPRPAGYMQNPPMPIPGGSPMSTAPAPMPPMPADQGMMPDSTSLSGGCCDTGACDAGFGYAALGQFNRCCQPCGGCAGAVAGDGWNCNNVSPWYAQAGALFLFRDHGNKSWTSYETNNNPNQIMNTSNASQGLMYGGQITIGRYCGCNCAGEFTYWGVGGGNGYAQRVSPPGGVSTPIDLSNSFLNGQPSSYYFDASPEHKLWRTDTIQNAELNFLQFPLTFSPTQRWRMAMLTGARWFNLNDGLIFGSVHFGEQFGQNGGADEAYLNIRTTNNLVGWQIGTRMSYFVTPRFSLFATPKFGLYNNFTSLHAQYYTGSGVYGFNINQTASKFAVLGEIDLGGSYYFTPRLSLFAAYRLVGVSGVALSDNQIPHYLVDTPSFNDIQRNGNLIVQGLYTGLSWNY
jgi:hypothetical protein